VKKSEEEEDVSPIEDVRAVLENIEDMLGKYMLDKGVPDQLEEDHLLSWGKKCLVTQP
jgi:hypothetical protein